MPLLRIGNFRQRHDFCSITQVVDNTLIRFLTNFPPQVKISRQLVILSPNFKKKRIHDTEIMSHGNRTRAGCPFRVLSVARNSGDQFGEVVLELRGDSPVTQSLDVFFKYRHPAGWMGGGVLRLVRPIYANMHRVKL